MNETIGFGDSASAGKAINADVVEQIKTGIRYQIDCYEVLPTFKSAYLAVQQKISNYNTRTLLQRVIDLLLFRPDRDALEAQLLAFPRRLKWTDYVTNLIPDVGARFILDTVLSGSAYTAANYMGLIGATGYTTGVAATDTMAAHGGWAEDSSYSQATRPAPSWSAAAGRAKTVSAAAAYSINVANVTIKGIFLTTVNTKGGATGTMISGGTFTGGDKVLVNGETLNVTPTQSIV